MHSTEPGPLCGLCLLSSSPLCPGKGFNFIVEESQSRAGVRIDYLPVAWRKPRSLLKYQAPPLVQEVGMDGRRPTLRGLGWAIHSSSKHSASAWYRQHSRAAAADRALPGQQGCPRSTLQDRTCSLNVMWEAPRVAHRRSQSLGGASGGIVGLGPLLRPPGWSLPTDVLV